MSFLFGEPDADEDSSGGTGRGSASGSARQSKVKDDKFKGRKDEKNKANEIFKLDVIKR